MFDPAHPARRGPTWPTTTGYTAYTARPDPRPATGSAAEVRAGAETGAGAGAGDRDEADAGARPEPEPEPEPGAEPEPEPEPGTATSTGPGEPVARSEDATAVLPPVPGTPPGAFVPPVRLPPDPVPGDQLHFTMPPEHSSPADARRHRKERLVAALRLFGRRGLEEGVAGHVTARDPEFTDCLWVNPFGVPFGHLTVSDLLLVNRDGQVVEGRHHVNQAAFSVHSQVHQARPDVVAVAHTPSTHGRALSALGELLDPLTQDACAFYEDHALLDLCTGVTVDEEESRRIAAALGPHKAVILRNRGLLTVGDSVDAAAWWFLQMEKSCEIQLAVRAAGKAVLIDRRTAVATREQLGSDLVAWVNYQPLYTTVTRDEPDLLS